MTGNDERGHGDQHGNAGGGRPPRRRGALHGTERASGSHGLLQAQYAFLELPKLPEQKPEAGAGYWAWLFVYAPELTEVPNDLPQGPYRAALELANEATFTPEERDAYQKVIDEIQQVRELAETKWAEGAREGELKGELKAKRDAILRLLMRARIVLMDDERARILACADPATLDRWFDNALGAKSAADVLT